MGMHDSLLDLSRNDRPDLQSLGPPRERHPFAPRPNLLDLMSYFQAMINPVLVGSDTAHPDERVPCHRDEGAAIIVMSST